MKNIYLPEYDIITGVSTGALNAGALNAGLLSYYNSKHNNSIVKGINVLIGPIIANQSYISETKDKITLIGSTNLNLGYLETFDFDKYNKSDQVEILMSSTAIPFVFPPNQMNGSTYVDGGLISNQILIGLKQKIKFEIYNIQF